MTAGAADGAALGAGVVLFGVELVAFLAPVLAGEMDGLGEETVGVELETEVALEAASVGVATVGGALSATGSMGVGVDVIQAFTRSQSMQFHFERSVTKV